MPYKKVPLVMDCPLGCHKGDSSSWIHADCGNEVYLDGNGYIICVCCDIKFFLSDWRFACKYHRNDFKRPSRMEWCDAIGSATVSTQTYFKNNYDSLAFFSAIQMRMLENDW